MIYKGPDLELREDRVIDKLGTIKLSDIPDPQPDCPVRLQNTTPILERLWRVALWDIESNIKETERGRYFAGGANFRLMVYTRDISYSGILGLNRVYPEIMRSSLEVTRNTRRALGFKVSRGHAVPEIDVPWEELDLSEGEFSARFDTNCYSRRTDDVVWLWAMSDLFSRMDAGPDDWTWLYETGLEFFERFYDPFYDSSDGLYRGQASFIDVAWPERPRPVGGYPVNFKVADCLLLKAASTNALYVKGMRVLADVTSRLGRDDEARAWTDRAGKLSRAIEANLVAPDGRIAYYKDRHGERSDRSEILGTSFVVLHDAVAPDVGAAAIKSYPRTGVGIPVITPFLDNDSAYHNNGSWPFSDTFFLSAAEKALGESQCACNFALLARTVRDDGFHEVVDIRSGAVKGSGHQLWSSAAFVNTCVRAGLV